MILRTIRSRVIAAFLLLAAMAALETALGQYVQRVTGLALAVLERSDKILHAHAEIGRALATMQSHQHGFFITRDEDELAQYRAQGVLFDKEAAEIRTLIVDPGLRRRFERIEAQVVEWRAVSQSLIEDGAAGAPVAARITGETAPRFQAILMALDAFEERQAARSQEATIQAQERVRWATIALALIPPVSMGYILLLLVAAERTILKPLAALAASARRLADGDYEASLPAPRNNEIGVLVGAFSDMRKAVQHR